MLVVRTFRVVLSTLFSFAVAALLRLAIIAETTSVVMIFVALSWSTSSGVQPSLAKAPHVCLSSLAFCQGLEAALGDGFAGNSLAAALPDHCIVGDEGGGIFLLGDPGSFSAVFTADLTDKSGA